MKFLKIKEVPMKKILAPSILSADFANLGRTFWLQLMLEQNTCISMLWMECMFRRFLLEIL